MLRRRSPVPPTPNPAPVRVRASDLAADGWLLPRELGVDGPPHWTLVGTVASPTVTPVDRTGLVVGEGWSLDWWIGADDRWHLPAREAAVRQDLVADAPVTETRLRIPGGDAVARAYGFRSPASRWGDPAASGGSGPAWLGDEWVGVEVENQTPVPFAVALVVRPFVADGLGSVGDITVEATSGGHGRDVAHLVRVDGRPVLILPRRPARMAVGNHVDGDVVDAVTTGRAGLDLAEANCPDGLATAAFVFPLPHTAVLRVALPIGAAVGAGIGQPSAMPDAATVASGWELHCRGPRFEVPDRRLSAALARARIQIQLAHDGEVVRRDGHLGDEIEPGATEAMLGAFDVLDQPNDVDEVLDHWIYRTATPSPATDVVVVDVVARHWLLHRSERVLDALLPDVGAAIERIDKADRRGRLVSSLDRWRAGRALRIGALMLAAAGQGDAAEAVIALGRRFTEKAGVIEGADGPAGDAPTVADRLLRVAADAGAGEESAVYGLDVVLAGLSATAAIPGPGPGPGRRPIGHDLAAAGALVLAARALLIGEDGDGLDLIPVLPPTWYGAGIEVHDAPTAHGRLSFAVRWHGRRPALLWELDPHDGSAPVMLRAPRLDPAWSSTEQRGEALLAEVSPPEEVELVSVVAEHPDIDPAMRRPGEQPESTAPAPNLPEGGTFS